MGRSAFFLVRQTGIRLKSIALGVKDMTTKTERLVFRTTPEYKTLIQRAAAWEGVSVTEFLSNCARDAARKTLEDRERMTLRGEEAVAFAQALLNPPAPNAALIELDREYRNMVEERVGK